MAMLPSASRHSQRIDRRQLSTPTETSTSVPAPTISTAPNDTTQLFNGVLFAESIDDTNGITFGGNSSTVIKGVVYTPDASFDMHGNPSITLDADFVVHDITPQRQPSASPAMPLSAGSANPLTSIALVE